MRSRISVLFLAGLVLGAIDAKAGPDGGSELADQVALFTDPAAFAAATRAEVFDPPVRAVGLEVLTNAVADHVLAVELEDGEGGAVQNEGLAAVESADVFRVRIATSGRAIRSTP